MTAADAEDVVQEFFLEAARTDLAEKFDATRGSVRPFLSRVFRHFLTKEMAKRQAAKRGGRKVVSLSVADDRVLDSMLEGMELRSPETVCQTREVTDVLQRSVCLLKEELNGKAKPSTYAALIPFLDSKGKHVSYRALGEKLGLSAGAARMKVMRLRRRLRTYVFKELEVEGDDTRGQSAAVQSMFRCLDP